MTKLECTVVNCMYNRDKACCKGNVHVSGEEAKMVSETSCESFRNRNNDQVTSSADMIPAKKTDISCDATACCYNELRKCDAEKIQMSGCDACNCEQTACSTFTVECR